jgi:digeranylgeranylglycerophospholipid reductase
LAVKDHCNMRKVAVAVVGAGPAGLHAAYSLSSIGWEVAVLDAQVRVGERTVCSGVIGEEAFRRFDLPPSSVLNYTRHFRAISPAGSVVEYRSPESLARIVDKSRFNQDLAEKAKGSGTRILGDRSVENIEVQPDSAVVTSRRSDGSVEKLRAEVALIAAGGNIGLNARLGMVKPQEFLRAAQADIDWGTDGAADPTDVFLGRAIAPGGFGWRIPLGNGRVRIGVMTNSDPRPHFSALLRRVAPGLDSSRVRVSLKAISQRPRGRCTADRVMVIGEAAGHVKTSTGGGIYYGLLSAEMAVHVLSRALQSGRPTAAKLHEFERLWRSSLGPEILIGFVGRKLACHLPDGVLERAFDRFARTDLIDSLGGVLSFDWHQKAIIASLRHLFAVPGVYPLLRGTLPPERGPA